MFIIFGDKHRTEPLADGIRRYMKCPKCGVEAVFRERVVSKQFRLYFVEMFTHGTQHVLECSDCGTAFVTDEVRAKAVENDQTGTVLGAIQGFARKGKQATQEALDGGLGKAIEQTGAEVGKALNAAQDRVGGLLARLQRRDIDPER
jgi:hypothetical protein